VRLQPAIYAVRHIINALFFLVILFSGINSENKAQWLTFLQIKIPFLLLPFAFCGFTFFDKAFFSKLLFAFVAVMLVSVTCVMMNYCLHYDEINARILDGSIIPVPFSHIRYTLMLVFSFFALIWLWEQHLIVMRYLLLIPALYFFIVIHVLLSRSGWLSLYLGLLFYFGVYVYRTRKYFISILMLGALIALPLLFYQLIPSFHNKISYMKYTTEQYHAGHIDDMSDAMRFTSWAVGMEIIGHHPLTGVGAGDLLKESKEMSKGMFPSIKNDDDRKMPHNEFIWICAATGIFGLLVYCVAFFLPLIISFRYCYWLFGILYIIFFTSFFTEYPLEEQIGSTFYLVFLLIFLTHFSYTTAND
jgi:O-antigen ligase